MSKTIYVSSGRQSVDLNAVEELFLTVGDVETCSHQVIPLRGMDQSFGVFEMSSVQQAVDCVERFNGQTLEGGLRIAVAQNRPVSREAAPLTAAGRRAARK